MTTPWQRLGYKLKLGLRTRPESHWLPRVDLSGDEAERASQLIQKSNLFTNKRAEVFAALPNAKLASGELLELVLEHLRKYHRTPPPKIDPKIDPELDPKFWVKNGTQKWTQNDKIGPKEDPK